MSKFLFRQKTDSCRLAIKEFVAKSIDDISFERNNKSRRRRVVIYNKEMGASANERTTRLTGNNAELIN